MKWRRHCCVASRSWEEGLPMEGNGEDWLLKDISSEVVGHHKLASNCEPKKKGGKKAQPHFRIIVSLYIYKKKASHTLTHAHTDISSHAQTLVHTRTSLNLSDTHTRACKIHKQTQMQCTNTKQMSSQSRWAPLCVELKASAKPVPLGRGGVHQPAEAPAWCPRVARVTLGLLPSHCLDQRGPLLSSRRWQRRG